MNNRFSSGSESFKKALLIGVAAAIVLSIVFYTIGALLSGQYGTAADNATIIPGIIGIFIAAIALYFYLRIEDPVIKESKFVKKELDSLVKNIKLLKFFIRQKKELFDEKYLGMGDFESVISFNMKEANKKINNFFENEDLSNLFIKLNASDQEINSYCESQLLCETDSENFKNDYNAWIQERKLILEYKNDLIEALGEKKKLENPGIGELKNEFFVINKGSENHNFALKMIKDFFQKEIVNPHKVNKNTTTNFILTPDNKFLISKVIFHKCYGSKISELKKFVEINPTTKEGYDQKIDELSRGVKKYFDEERGHYAFFLDIFKDISRIMKNSSVILFFDAYNSSNKQEIFENDFFFKLMFEVDVLASLNKDDIEIKFNFKDNSYQCVFKKLSQINEFIGGESVGSKLSSDEIVKYLNF